MIYRELTAYNITDELLADDNAAWTHDGALALAKWLIEANDGALLELDIVSIRGEWNEYASLADYLAEYASVEAETWEDVSENWPRVIEIEGTEGAIVESH